MKHFFLVFSLYFLPAFAFDLRPEIGIGYEKFSPLGNYNPPMSGLVSQAGIYFEGVKGKNFFLACDYFYRNKNGKATDETGETSGKIVSNGIFVRSGYPINIKMFRVSPFLGLGRATKANEKLVYRERSEEFNASMTEFMVGALVTYPVWRMHFGLDFDGYFGALKMPSSDDSYVGFRVTLVTQMTIWKN